MLLEDGRVELLVSSRCPFNVERPLEAVDPLPPIMLCCKGSRRPDEALSVPANA